MFNFQGQEIFIIFVLALIVLGPERLPEAMRKLGSFVAEIRNMAGGFQQEFKAVVDEPMRQMRESADMIRKQTDIRNWQSSDNDPEAATDGTTTPSSTAANGSVGLPPVTSTPTPHVPTFEPTPEPEQSLIVETEAFAAVASPGTDLRESTAPSSVAPNAPTDNANAENAPDSAEPAASTDDVPTDHGSQLLRDLQFARQPGVAATADDGATAQTDAEPSADTDA